MLLNKTIVSNSLANVHSIPNKTYFQLPEKVLQFGTGVLLRGLCDHYIDIANKQGVFNGRVVVIKSTPGDNEFETQDNLYTVCLRGVNEQGNIEQNWLNASISRVLVAQQQWNDICKLAISTDIEIVLSNTTEVGIVYQRENVLDEDIVPESYPAKLTQLLYKRFKHFNGDTSKGWIIIPTELVANNGTLLKQIVLQQIEANQLASEFKNWVINANYFCNSLVDRIVPGKPKGDLLEKINNALPYDDNLKLVAELYNLWAIEGDEAVSSKLSFAKVCPEVIVEKDIDIYRELKLRLLNGSHSFHCGLAHLAGFKIVRDAFLDINFKNFATHLIYDEIASAIPYKIDETTKKKFADSLFNRLVNPYLDHQWLDITLHYSSKMKMRNIALVENYYTIHNKPPKYMAAGFAAYILFMNGTKKEDCCYYGNSNGGEYKINDKEAVYFNELYSNNSIEDVVTKVLSNTQLWGVDLTKLNGFQQQIIEHINKIKTLGARDFIKQF